MRRMLTSIGAPPLSMPWSVPLLVLVLVALSACGGSAPPQPTTGAPRARVPEAYSFVLTSSCGERNLLGTYRVRVEGEEVVRAEPVGRVSRPALEDVPTIADLEAKIERAGPEAVVEVERDDTGLLTSVSIDPRQDTIDDEECYRVSRLTAALR